MQNIPLQGGSINAHQVFVIQLGDNLIEFNLNYLQTGQWSVDLSLDDEVLVAGAMLEPNADIIAPYRTDIGQLVFTGKNTTLDNLGLDNKLTWIPPDV